MQQGIDYIGLGVGGIIFNEDGRIFASLRGKGVRNEPGTWEFPGGGVEFGETAMQAIERETLEEFGMTVTAKESLGYIDFLLPEVGQHWVGLHFLCELTSGEGTICEPDKCEKIGWFSAEELLTLDLSTPTKKLIANLEEKRSAPLTSIEIHTP